MVDRERSDIAGETGAHPDEPGCSILATIDLIGDRRSLGILRCVMLGYRRFGQFQSELDVATNVLTERLRTLVDRGILERAQYSERPPRYEYVLSETAKELIPAFLLLKAWGDRHLRGGHGPATEMIHEPCGHVLAPSLVCTNCREPVDPETLRVQWVGESAGDRLD